MILDTLHDTIHESRIEMTIRHMGDASAESSYRYVEYRIVVDGEEVYLLRAPIDSVRNDASMPRQFELWILKNLQLTKVGQHRHNEQSYGSNFFDRLRIGFLEHFVSRKPTTKI